MEDRMSYNDINNLIGSRFSERSIQQGNAADAARINRSVSGGNFQDMLEEQLNKNALNNQSEIQFSKHAQKRVEQRGIQITDSFLQDLNQAVAKGRQKGSKDMVVIDRTGAFIVNVPNNIVVTAISEAEMKENVFTNIDSAVII